MKTPDEIIEGRRDEIPTEIYDLSLEILDKLPGDFLESGKSPYSIACGTVYIAHLLGNRIRTQREMAEIFGISEQTLRYTADEVEKYLIEEEFLEVPSDEH